MASVIGGCVIPFCASVVLAACDTTTGTTEFVKKLTASSLVWATARSVTFTTSPGAIETVALVRSGLITSGAGRLPILVNVGLGMLAITTLLVWNFRSQPWATGVV